MNVAMLLDIPASIVPEDVLLLGTDEVTYESARERVAKAAGLLAGLGVEPGDRVGVFATNSATMVEAILAASARGATVVPMNFRARRDEAAHLLKDSGSKVVLAESRYRALVEEVRPGNVEHLLWLDEDYAGRRDEADPDYEIADVDDDELATLLYTSGTTAMPKGVMLTHGALSGYVMGAAECADGTDKGRTILAAPLYHIAGLTSLLTSMYSGRSTIVLPQFEAGAWLEAVEAQKATHAFLVPTMLARILDHPDAAKRDLSSLELVTYGAAPMPPSVIRRALDVFPKNVGFSGAYGQTETTSTVTVLDADDHRMEGTPAEIETKMRRLASVGKPMDDVEIRVIDEAGNPAGARHIGEVQLRTGRRMVGYWGADEKTRVTVDDEDWVHTGDLGYLDEDGYLFLTGRAGDMIIRGGENIAPEEVEAVLYEHPSIVEAAVVGIPDEEWGERVVAAVVRKDGADLDEAGVIAFCSEHLAAFKRPERVVFVETLPRTSTGKLLRRELVPQLS